MFYSAEETANSNVKEGKEQTRRGKSSDNMREKMPNWVGTRWLKPQKCRGGHTQLSRTFISITQVGCQSRKTGQFYRYWNNIHFEQGMGKNPT